MVLRVCGLMILGGFDRMTYASELLRRAAADLETKSKVTVDGLERIKLRARSAAFLIEAAAIEAEAARPIRPKSRF